MIGASVSEVNALMPNPLRHPSPWLRAFWQRAYRENVTGLSAMVAYNLMLAVFPFALLVLFVFGQVLKIQGVETGVLDDLQRLFPNVEQGTLSDALDRIEENSTTIGIAAFLGSLWIGASFWGRWIPPSAASTTSSAVAGSSRSASPLRCWAWFCSSSRQASCCRRSRRRSSPALIACPWGSPTSS